MGGQLSHRLEGSRTLRDALSAEGSLARSWHITQLTCPDEVWYDVEDLREPQQSAAVIERHSYVELHDQIDGARREHDIAVQQEQPGCD